MSTRATSFSHHASRHFIWKFLFASTSRVVCLTLSCLINKKTRGGNKKERHKFGQHNKYFFKKNYSRKNRYKCNCPNCKVICFIIVYIIMYGHKNKRKMMKRRGCESSHSSRMDEMEKSIGSVM